MFGRSDGFSVVETLIALVILAGMLAAFGSSLSGGWRGIAAAEARMQALGLAKNELERAGVEWPLVAGSWEAKAPGGLTYSVDVAPYASPDQMPLGGNPAAYWVTVVVTRTLSPLGASPPIRLRTLKLAGGR